MSLVIYTLMLISIFNAIILIILLSYKKNGFDHLIDCKQSLDSQTLTIKILLKKIEEFVLRIDEDMKNNISAEKEALHSINLMSKQLNGIQDILKNCSIKENDTKDIPELNITAYKDAVIAFNNINESFYEIRKCSRVAHKLMEILVYGKDISISTDDIPDNIKDVVSSLKSKIMLFNRNYKQYILNYLKSKGKTWDSCVRYPLNKEFDSNWDENMLDNVEKGAIVERVVQLGFEFPDAPIIGRIKSKIIIE